MLISHSIVSAYFVSKLALVIMMIDLNFLTFSVFDFLCCIASGAKLSFASVEKDLNKKINLGVFDSHNKKSH